MNYWTLIIQWILYLLVFIIPIIVLILLLTKKRTGIILGCFYFLFLLIVPRIPICRNIVNQKNLERLSMLITHTNKDSTCSPANSNEILVNSFQYGYSEVINGTDYFSRINIEVQRYYSSKEATKAVSRHINSSHVEFISENLSAYASFPQNQKPLIYPPFPHCICYSTKVIFYMDDYLIIIEENTNKSELMIATFIEFLFAQNSSFDFWLTHSFTDENVIEHCYPVVTQYTF